MCRSVVVGRAASTDRGDRKHVIHKFTNDGKQLVMTIGETGVAGDDATHFGMPQWGTYGMQPGQFWEPHQISIDSEGNLYIADSFGGRTQKYVPAKAADRSKLLRQ